MTNNSHLMGDASAMQNLLALIDACQSLVVFTGAGISTESGIPDYRGPGGIWKKFRPVTFQEFMESESGRQAYWERKFATDDLLRQARPNKGHMALAELVRRGRASCVITQNIDGLHQLSGIPEAQVVELHGNTTYAHCLSCHKRFTLEVLKRDFLDTGKSPLCECGGFVKTATISFGQPMPEDAMRRAQDATLSCDLFLAVGSSLTVYPASGFPITAKQNGARLVILNRESTELDRLADFALQGEAGPILASLVEKLYPPRDSRAS